MPVADESTHAKGQGVPAFRKDAERVWLWAIPAPLRPASAPGTAPATARVLLAEDNVIAQTTIRRLLEQQGMEVVCAVNGLEAVGRFEEGRYDVVILDILMPDMDGFEVTTRIREQERRGGTGQTPVIALTSYSLRAILDKCKRVGMNGYLAKPVSNADLKLLFAGLAGSGARGPEAGGEHSLLDVRGSLDNLGGDLGLYREIVGMFAESAPEVMRELISALDGADAARAEQHAHNLKGMAANIGARRLAELAGIIQHGARASRPGECQAWIPRLRDELESLMAALAAAGETLGS
ncbi:MAG TPA: response regulator [Desulfuromonadaceae bacterium]